MFGSNQSRGFTLLEIVLVVLILGILALAVAPVIGRTVGGVGIKTEALRLAEDIRYTQHAAFSEGQNFRLALDTSTGSYRVYPVGHTGDVRKEAEMGDSVAGISSSDLPTDEDMTYITYLPTGAPSQAGSITLSNDSGGSISVIIALGTGRVRVQ